MRDTVADTSQQPVPLGKVLRKEHDEIMEVRSNRLADFKKGSPRPLEPAPAVTLPTGARTAGKTPDLQQDDPEWAEVIREAHGLNLVGLAFSGGGIRSATFNLGVLQALADLKLLYRIDYLSTVSGGGYIGSWLAAWIKRLGSFAKVQEQISTHRVNLQEDKEQTPVRFLRVFSNYLTPKLGFFSGDTWAMVAIYLRNLLLNQAILFGLLATLLLLPRAANQWAGVALHSPNTGLRLIEAGGGMLLVSFLIILLNMGYLSVSQMKSAPRLTEQKWVLMLVGAPLFATAVVTALWFARPLSSASQNASMFLLHQEFFPYQDAVLLGAIVYCAIWGLARLGELLFRKPIKDPSPLPHYRGELAVEAGAALCAGALAGWLLAVLYGVPLFKNQTDALTYCVPLVVGVFLLAGVLHIGLMGVVFRDWKREWWGRLGGWLLLFAFTWLVLFWLALFFPCFMRGDALVIVAWKAVLAKCLTPAWIVSTIGTVLAGNSKASGKPGAVNWIDTAIKVGPYVFVVGLLCWISFALDWFLGTNGPLWWTLLACVAVTLVMAWRVDINQFSMHMFYRNRLVGCFLGASREMGASHDADASRKARSPNRFTGFDPDDDLPLKDLRWNADPHYDGPYPVLNAALNLVKGKDLAWQERKAESFVMTPYYCGYDVWLEEQDSPMLVHDRPLADGKKMPGTTPPETVSVPAQQASVSAKTGDVARGQVGVSSEREVASSETQNSSTKTWREKTNDKIYGWFHKLERYGYRPTEDYVFPSPKFHGPNLGLAMAISVTLPLQNVSLSELL